MKNRKRKKVDLKKKYICCLAVYYDPVEDSKPRDLNIVRITAAITDLSKDQLVDKVEFWSDNGVNCDDVTQACIDLANKYDTILHSLSEPVPLEVCSCGCGNYLMEVILSDDLAKIQKSLN